MTPSLSTEIAIIGAGVIGMAIAERLTAAGHEVVLIDPAPPGSGCSYGNAGTIADYAVEPVGTPDVLKSLPSMLFDRMSPLAIRRQALPALAPWLLRFALQSLPAAAARNAQALAFLLQEAGPMWQALAQRIGAEAILQHRGCLYLYQSPEALQAAQSAMARRRALGVEVTLLNQAELAALEPGLSGMAGAAFFPQALFLDDPGAMMDHLASHLQSRTALIASRVERLSRQGLSVLLEGPGLQLSCRKVILATGAHSRALAVMAGDKIPLDTERGYHVEWDMPEPLLNRPACPTARGFYLCPMQGRLRVAGTVELGGLTAPPSPHRIAQLIKGAREIFPQLPAAPDRSWMGFRPSLPDSLPVIGASRNGGQVIHAYGHGHLGLTMAPITARIVADLVAGRSPHQDFTPVSPLRF